MIIPPLSAWRVGTHKSGEKEHKTPADEQGPQQQGPRTTNDKPRTKRRAGIGKRTASKKARGQRERQRERERGSGREREGEREAEREREGGREGGTHKGCEEPEAAGQEREKGEKITSIASISLKKVFS